MATNPMQRKARNSFLMGMLVMLVIAGVIIAGLVFLLIEFKKEEQVREGRQITTYVLTKDLKSGEKITASSYTQVSVVMTNAPSDYIASPAELAEDSVAKIGLTSGTILSKNMISSSEEKVTADLRLQEYNMLILPVQIDVGDYIDVRLTLHTGQDYIVISKKRVINVEEHTIWLELTEDEILTMSNAIVEAYTMTGSNLYVNLYVEPGMQKVAIPTYPVSRAVLNQMEGNPNIVKEAMDGLRSRYTQSQINQRNDDINSALENYSADAQGNVEAKVKEQNERTKALREKYLETLSAY